MDLSSRTPIYARASGDDLTADGTLELPFSSAQAAFDYALGLGSSGSYVLDFGSGNFGGVTVTTEWPERIAVRGEGATTTRLGDVNASSDTCYDTGEFYSRGNNGKNVYITSDGSINLGNVSSNGSSSCNLGNFYIGGNGGQIRLKDVACGNVSANGGSSQDTAGNGGTITLDGVTCENITANTPRVSTNAGNGGVVSLTNCEVLANIDVSSLDNDYNNSSYGRGGTIIFDTSTALVLNITGPAGRDGQVLNIGAISYTNIIGRSVLYYTNGGGSGNNTWETLSNWNTRPDGTGLTAPRVPWKNSNLTLCDLVDATNGAGVTLNSSVNGVNSTSSIGNITLSNAGSISGGKFAGTNLTNNGAITGGEFNPRGYSVTGTFGGTAQFVVYIRTTGNDQTADGTLALPYSTAQRAYSDTYRDYAMSYSDIYPIIVLDFGAGNFGGINLTTQAQPTNDWPLGIQVRGAGANVSFMGGITGTDGNLNGRGNYVTIISDKSINLGDIDLTPSLQNNYAGGSISLTNCVARNLSVDGSDRQWQPPQPASGIKGQPAGTVYLDNSVVGTVSLVGGRGSDNTKGPSTCTSNDGTIGGEGGDAGTFTAVNGSIYGTVTATRGPEGYYGWSYYGCKDFRSPNYCPNANEDDDSCVKSYGYNGVHYTNLEADTFTGYDKDSYFDSSFTKRYLFVNGAFQDVCGYDIYRDLWFNHGNLDGTFTSYCSNVDTRGNGLLDFANIFDNGVPSTNEGSVLSINGEPYTGIVGYKGILYRAFGTERAAQVLTINGTYRDYFYDPTGVKLYKFINGVISFDTFYFNPTYNEFGSDYFWSTLSNWSENRYGTGTRPTEIPWTGTATAATNLALGAWYDVLTNEEILGELPVLGELVIGNNPNVIIVGTADDYISRLLIRISLQRIQQLQS